MSTCSGVSLSGILSPVHRDASTHIRMGPIVFGVCPLLPLPDVITLSRACQHAPEYSYEPTVVAMSLHLWRIFAFSMKVDGIGDVLGILPPVHNDACSHLSNWETSCVVFYSPASSHTGPMVSRARPVELKRLILLYYVSCDFFRSQRRIHISVDGGHHV